MGRLRGAGFLLFILLVGIPLTVGGNANAQSPNPPAKSVDRQLTPQETDRFFDDMSKASGVRRYEGLCARAKDFVAKKGAVNDALLSQFNTLVGVGVLDALLDFCATGRFVLNFYNSDRKCPVKAPLAPIHMELIQRLPFIRSSDVEIIALGCVETKARFSLLNPRAHSILINDSDLGGLELTGGQLTFNLEIFDTTVGGETRIEGMTIGSSINVTRSTFGLEGGKGQALTVKTSNLGTIWIRNTRFNGNLSINANEVKGDVQLGLYNAEPGGQQDVTVVGGATIVNNDIKGDLRVTSADISGYLDLRSNSVERGLYVCRHTSVGDWFELFNSRATTLELCDLNVAGDANAVGMRVSESVYIGQSSGGTGKEEATFKKGFSLRNLKADRLRIENVNINDQLTLIAMTVSSVSILDSKIGKKIHSGDARVSSISFRNTTVPDFECSDCVVSLYLLLAGKFSGEVNLRGAQIRASLVLRDGKGDDNASVFLPGSRLDLRSIQVESIEADYCDLLIKTQSAEKCVGPFVPTMITGATFKNIVAGRNPESTGVPSGLLDQDASKIVSWIRTSSDKERFHPQPYDLVADALERAGRHHAAIQVRIAKLDDEYASGNHSLLMRGAAKIASVLTGYGYQNERSVVAFALLVIAGMLVFWFGRHVSPVHMHDLKLSGFFNVLWYSFWFSIDRAVPPLHIDESMKEYSVLTPLSRAYFYFHRGVGTIIISFFLAGISGLFK